MRDDREAAKAAKTSTISTCSRPGVLPTPKPRRCSGCACSSSTLAACSRREGDYCKLLKRSKSVILTAWRGTPRQNDLEEADGLRPDGGSQGSPDGTLRAPASTANEAMRVARRGFQHDFSYAKGRRNGVRRAASRSSVPWLRELGGLQLEEH